MAQTETDNSSKANVWFIDSGCSNHMCNTVELFTSLDNTFNHSVKLGNNSKMIVEGKGTVQITLNEVTYGVGNVYFVLALKNNLLSVGQLQEKGLSVVFKGDICTLYHPMRGKMAQTKMRANRMFTLISEKPNGDDEKCLQTTVPEITKLWHERYGHYGSSLQVADIMTKPLKIDSFLKLRSMMGMCEFAEVS
ncbi:hypothetical protein LIER_42172 [Lithospermum erythrorhizon]|uniref:Retrovirus-related Pol polyprotein from transposon TNT 1-94-like beta-barrel domain-containing protein n=1 Tax=Lithospermum erythrorhizon TaxID=34254 RepID=A0AAV3RP41_LITER